MTEPRSPPIIIQTTIPNFNDNDRRYRFWCCHVRNWAKAIAVVGVIAVIIQITIAITYYSAGQIPSTASIKPYSNDVVVFLIPYTVFAAIAVAVLIIGIKTENPTLLVPEIIYLVRGLILHDS